MMGCVKGSAAEWSLNCCGFHKIYDASRFQILNGLVYRVLHYRRAARTKLLTAKYVNSAHTAMYAYTFIAPSEFAAA